MSDMKEIRTLEAHEIEVKVGNGIKSTGASFLLYKDARCDMAILDEVFGVTGWQRRHETINGNLFCIISLWDNDKNCWVDKMDVGVPSSYEKVKGEASDSFKRAGTNVGIGRELYTSPFIWIALGKGETYQKDGKTQIAKQVHFKVSEIEYDKDRKISKLVIMDQTGAVRYSHGSSKKASNPAAPKAKNNGSNSKHVEPKPTESKDEDAKPIADRLVELMMKKQNVDESKAKKILIATYKKETGKTVSAINFISKEYKEKYLTMLE